MGARKSCSAFEAAGTEVWLALGQSNAANHAETRRSAGPRVGAFDGSRCIPARDPLPGGDGENGSIWTPLAQAWLGERRSPRILIAVVAKGATAIADWQPGGALHRRALDTIARLRGRGLKVTRILWLQGEADAILNTSGKAYETGLTRALEPLHAATGASVYIPSVGRCGAAFSTGVRAAQQRVAASRDWALPGPDLDLIGTEGRHERCHYARAGQEIAVKLWLTAFEKRDVNRIDLSASDDLGVTPEDRRSDR